MTISSPTKGGQGHSMREELRHQIFDRGPRPALRGRLHTAAAWYFAGTSTALTVVAIILDGYGMMSLVTAVYSVCLVGMLATSALYHRAPWRSEATVQGWRRADHVMIAVFIAGTYGPVTVGAFGSEWFHNAGWGYSGGLWIVALSWVAAAVAAALNIIWLHHPRGLSTSVYLMLGSLAIVAPLGFFYGIGLAASILIGVGGLVYTLGSLVYAARWPNPSERWFGFHEVFHATTIIAAALHHIAIWLIVLR
ncbi:hemolysin III family protein [uncultured Corynebacterium sp.]|uniref:PAQR family membrane homeostasis protein TrhA n=1 Tax=uncultured Corynebacterium sp. TaxID=159447 RepID=UPI00338EBC9C